MYLDPNQNHHYKIFKTAHRHILFDCWMKGCRGRLQLNRRTNLKEIIVEHNEHASATIFDYYPTATVVNVIRTQLLDKHILAIARNKIFINKTPNKIYNEAVESFGQQVPTLPLLHKEKWIENISNIRYRGKHEAQHSEKNENVNNAANDSGIQSMSKSKDSPKESGKTIQIFI